MAFFDSIKHWFSGLFHTTGADVQRVLHNVSGLVNLAIPIVEGIDQEIKASIGSVPTVAAEHLATIDKFLVSTVSPDLAKIQGFTSGLVGKDMSVALHDIAVFALSFLAPSSSVARLLNLAVEMAYNVYVQAKH